MSVRKVANVVGLLLIFLAGAMVATAILAFSYGGGDARAFVLSAAITAVSGAALYWGTRFEGDVTTREGFAIVTFSWLLTAVFGTLPYLFAGVTDHPAAAFFEAMSGFTTTGATVFGDVEALPQGILFWRSLSHWIGGMGIIVLVIAILPYLGVGGMQLFRAEVPGPTPERLRPRITQTAKLLWLVYFGLTLLAIVLFVAGGMPGFDAVNHAFSTIATGGFSTRNTSFADYSAYIQWVTTALMYVAGINFALHFRAVTGRFGYLSNEEWRFYTGVLLLVASCVALINALSAAPGDATTAVRTSFFQVAAITTTTGFASDDYSAWLPGAQMLILALYFVGGMAGSTSGGIKTMRVRLLLRQTANEVRRQLHPRAVFVTRIAGAAVKPDAISRVVGFVILHLILCLVGAIALGLIGVDFVSALTGSIASVGNVGPAFGEFGPTLHYGGAPPMAQVILAFLMLLGRLEIYTVLVLFHPELWKARGARR